VQQVKIIFAPKSFIVIVLRNLLKNAASYSQQAIIVNWDATSVCIQNPCSDHSMLEQSQGYGYGLIIIERICERMDCSLKFKQTEQTYKVCVAFKPPIEEIESID